MINFSSPERIVVGVDGSPGAARAARWAAELAGSLGANLHLLHALNLAAASSLLSRLPFEEYRQDRVKQGEAMLDETRAELLGRHPRLWISTEISPQEPALALVSSTGRATLTVIGTRGRGGFPGLRLGSVGLRLAAHSRGPIVLVPGAARTAAEPQPPAGQSAPRNEIVLGVEARESACVIGYAFDMAEALGAQVRAVHAWEPIPPYNGYYYIDPSVQATTAEELLDTALEPARQAHGAIHTSADTVCGSASAALVEAGRGARLLVLGAHRHRMPFSIGVGAVLHALLTHAPCPVAVVPLTTTET